MAGILALMEQADIDCSAKNLAQSRVLVGTLPYFNMGVLVLV